ncbi:MAG: Glutamine synthetase type I [uncultured Thermomicrobiales bacterium]|uniref:Glutamine synthetase type I n=1 Tax=uncultured Thermomicrobiales bacterium TaxID=1645740 RepID=A0A6J4V7T6_9BACT|nr:MAG: Glutamine synthetase type I [uncultured Thermomicrobiales bacterium]
MGERPSENQGVDAVLARLDGLGAQHLWVQYADYNGRSQGKSVPRARFAEALAGGISFARANLGFNLTDAQAPDTGFGADSGDFLAVPDPAALAPLPYAPGAARAIAWMRRDDGAPWEGCPRSALLRQVEAYAERGLSLRVAFEPEAYLFEAGPDGPRPIAADGMFTVAALERTAAFLQAVGGALETMGVEVEQVAPEYGPGQIEINIRHAEPVKAADDLITLKDAARAVARAHGLVASFMPKPFETIAGCGLHVHLSLWSADGGSAMAGDEDGAGDEAPHPSGFGPTGRGFLGGILAHARGLCGLGAPTVNSYKRLRPGSWAPAHAAYAVANRSALVRIPGASRRRVEFRAGDNTSNPYIFLTGLLAAGLDGIERGLEPGSPAEGDLGHLSPAELAAQGIILLPRTAGEALDAVAADGTLLAALGPTVGGEWLKVKRSELAIAETVVSPWERETYLRG